MKKTESTFTTTRAGLALVTGALLLFAGSSLEAQTPAKAKTETAAQKKEKAADQKKENVEAQKLDTVVVKEAAVTSTDVAEYDLDKIPGATSLVKSTELEKGRVGTVADVLKYQPGILAQSVNGGEATRLSIRGSGIIRGGFLFGWGNVLQLDGQRLYSTSGNPYETIEPLALSRVEVLKGANAFENGPLSLGGSLNYVTKTGYDASPFQARVEAGSYGYLRQQVSSGLVEGPADYYASVTRFDKEGYRNNTESKSTRIVTNVGFQITPDIHTRFNFRFAEQYQEDAGNLTWSQLQTDPKLSQFADIRARINPGTYLAGNTTKFQIDPDSSFETGFQYDNSPIDSGGGAVQNNFEFQGFSGSLRYKRNDLIFGEHQSKTQVAFINHTQLDSKFESLTPAGVYNAKRPATQSDWTLLAQNDFEAVSNFWITTGVAGIFQTRKTEVTESTNAAIVGQGIEADYYNIAPKLALRYEFTPKTQVYTSVSRTVDTPSANSFIRTNGAFVPQEFLDLKEATATNVEVGTKGEAGIFNWNVSFYHSWINNELLTVQISPVATTASNATPTIHQGIEAGLDTTLWENKSLDTSNGQLPEQLVLRNVYTWNNFHFVNDQTAGQNFGDNSLAGVPEHLWQGELVYDHPSGFYVGVNAEASISEYAADFANSIHNDAYAIWGFKIGYQQPAKGWEVFLELRNISDEQYASVVSPVFNANSVDSAVYSPGEGRTVTGGVSYRF